jgi:hypothetical protein
MNENVWILKSHDAESKHSTEAGLVLQLDTICRLGFDDTLEVKLDRGGWITGQTLKSWWQARSKL